MRIGLTLPTPGENPDLATLLGAVEHAEKLGLAAAWMPNISSRGFDAPMALALAGARTRRIELGTFVVPTFTRHTIVMAQQALSAQAATGGRFVLGIGLSHRSAMEGQLGFDSRGRSGTCASTSTCLTALLRGQTVDFTGEQFQVHNFTLTPPPGVTAPPILVAALGPQMLATGRAALRRHGDLGRWAPVRRGSREGHRRRRRRRGPARAARARERPRV